MFKAKTKVYISGPYTRGNVNQNVRNAIAVGDYLTSFNFVPYIPHLSYLWDIVKPHSYDFWLNYDFEWVVVCDVLLRLPGESNGAEKEIVVATQNSIPVLLSMADLFRCFPPSATDQRRIKSFEEICK